MAEQKNIKDLLSERIDPDRLSFLRSAGIKSSARGFRTFVVGGFVRDLLMGFPVLDLDLSVEGDAEALALSLLEDSPGKLVAHGRFKTATVFLKSGARVDISTAREEKYKRPASLPEVVSSSIYSDLYRRDFTINAMAVSINPENFGELTDCFDCRKDLSDGIIRLLHEKSLEDDPTRIFRAVRFASRFGFKIAPETEMLIREAVRLRLCDALSGRRLRNEVFLLLNEKDPAAAVELSQKYGVESSIHHEISLTRRGALKTRRLMEFMLALRSSLRDLSFERWLVCFMEMARSGGVKNPGAVSKRLMMSKHESAAVKSLERADLVLKELYSVENGPDSGVYCLFGREPMELIVLSLASLPEDRAGKLLGRYRRALKTGISTTGRDLLRMGYEPGPGFKRILEETLKAKIDGKLDGKNEEIEFIRKSFKRKG